MQARIFAEDPKEFLKLIDTMGTAKEKGPVVPDFFYLNQCVSNWRRIGEYYMGSP